MDALILSCGTGGGHDSAARAILEEMKLRGHNAVMLNPYTLKSGRLAAGINNTYIAAARSAPRTFGAVYQLGNLYRRLPFRSPVYFINHSMNEVLEEYLSENHFNVVITTHLFPAEILTNMEQHGLDVPKTIFVATDYVCIPFTEETECDAYVIPAADLKEDFSGRGLPAEKLCPLGIPTSRCFRELETREEARQRLKLDPEKRYILVTGGSMGGGNIEKAIEKLRLHFESWEDTSLIIICGSNKVLYNKLHAQSDPRLVLLGRTEDMAGYMRSCDLFITKPGGLSSTEAAVRGVPIFHTAAIPGCESHNARFFSQRGMSIAGDLSGEALKEADMLLQDAEKRAAMLACQKSHVNPSAAADICALAERLKAET